MLQEEIITGPKYKHPPKGKMTFEEFLSWCDEDTWAEWVDGEVIMLSPASSRHQHLSRFLTTVLGMFVEVRELGVILTAPFPIKIAVGLPAREPDLMFIAKEHVDRLRSTYFDGPADLVIEIASSESRLHDRGEKRAEYEIGGVPEYWIIDDELRRTDFYQLDPQGRYRLIEPDEQGIYRSAIVPGFWLCVDWLWQEPLPPTLNILRELGVI